MIYGYGRVSTKGQAKDGNSLEAQERLLKEHGAEVIYMDWNRWRTWWRNREKAVPFLLNLIFFHAKVGVNFLLVFGK